MKIDRETTVARIEALIEARMIARSNGFRTGNALALQQLRMSIDQLKRTRLTVLVEKRISEVLPELKRLELELMAEIADFERKQADRDLELMTKAPNAFNLWGFFGLFS